jgi:hypothetical protein
MRLCLKHNMEFFLIQMKITNAKSTDTALARTTEFVYDIQKWKLIKEESWYILVIIYGSDKCWICACWVNGLVWSLWPLYFNIPRNLQNYPSRNWSSVMQKKLMSIYFVQWTHSFIFLLEVLFPHELVCWISFVNVALQKIRFVNVDLQIDRTCLVNQFRK